MNISPLSDVGVEGVKEQGSFLSGVEPGGPETTVPVPLPPGAVADIAALIPARYPIRAVPVGALGTERVLE